MNVVEVIIYRTLFYGLITSLSLYALESWRALVSNSCSYSPLRLNATYNNNRRVSEVNTIVNIMSHRRTALLNEVQFEIVEFLTAGDLLIAPQG
ncbi:hypothetical protein GQ600_17946 [Phytophthora cactorum]|nr:hypothetical protein GQ600_17946 [Phytophthora cactorum]